MKTFLEYVAADMLERYGTNLSRVAVVFPNKRASLFLNQALAQQAEQPIWSPTYITISELFRSRTSLTVVNPIKAVCMLHRIFIKITGRDEPLDHFFGWGQLLISDFDDVDKNMADAAQLFSNVRNLHELDSIDYLDEEQKQLIMRFFSNFSGDPTVLKQRFLDLWCHLYDIYVTFRRQLRNDGLAYEGMLYRDVVEQDMGEYPFDHYLFVGFNVLQKVEQRLFRHLKEEGKADFYWDYDDYYMRQSTHEAGTYLRKWIAPFPNRLDDNDADIYDHLGKNKELTFISSPTENLQARYISTWLREHERWRDGKRTAIVMADENLLQTVIHCIPPEVEAINVTTGFPLQQTPITSWVNHLFLLQTAGYSESEKSFHMSYVRRVLQHPYAQLVSPLATDLGRELIESKRFFADTDTLAQDEGLRLLFASLGTYDDEFQHAEHVIRWMKQVVETVALAGGAQKGALFQESVFRMFTLLQQLEQLIANETLDCDLNMLRRLLTQLIAVTSIPFHGEPARGVQVMGVLETRNLDFDHVLILSCNEGNMPKGVDDSSVIPHALRSAYELTTIDNKVAIYSYYFHRLIQRAKDVTIMYNNSTEGGKAGEMSRFMLQLMVEWPYPIRKLSLQTGQESIQTHAMAIKKDEKVMAQLKQLTKFSPTMLTKYLHCQLRFYYNYVANLYEQVEANEDELDVRSFGLIFHRAAQLMYDQLLPKDRITSDDIDQLLKQSSTKQNPLLPIVEEATAEEYFHLPEGTKRHPKLNGLQLLSQQVVIKYLKQLLKTDKRVAPLHIIAHETDVERSITFTAQGEEYEVLVGGRIDRVDEVLLDTPEWHWRVVDYKTGTRQAKELDNVDEVFDRTKMASSHADYQLQVMLYSMLLSQMRDDRHLPPYAISPALLFIQHANQDDYTPELTLGGKPISDIRTYVTDFEQHLKLVLAEIFDASKPFQPNDDTASCATCPYSVLCGREVKGKDK